MSDLGALPAQDGPSVPTETVLGWRDVYSGQWTVDRAGYIWTDSLKGGRCHVADVRGWGYLTGGGMGALGLDDLTASRIQDEVGRLLSAAPDLLEALGPLVAADQAAADHFDAFKDEDETVSLHIPVRVIRRAMDAFQKATGSRCKAGV